ncbi:hypothetical protein Ddye_009691 [Dipteronia dyeriana]|uniref:Reverse transcriptase domain-containing protein n=1 Tax=Dipteronia dyeriana TaxID=168575 RepID=A0AAD9XBY9_9ROSI|nr:hypothetical protein Ddye_009691 [Dipteronia dyeriana]
MAFVQDQQLLDSFVVADEIIHHWKKSKDGGLVVKLDFEKAYDSLDYNYLDNILSDIGFGEKWREWMSYFISTPSFLVLVNGSLSRQFRLERGLCQGDPLSPFLFDIVVECLSALFKKAGGVELVKGAVFGEGTVHISHLQFADDKILFLQPKLDYLMNARHILRCFELVSGLRINFYKSCVVRVGKEKEGVKVIVGDGNRIRLWRDVKVEGEPMMEAFPRIFALAINKERRHLEYGHRIGVAWIWDILLRRPCFGWEVDQREAFLVCIRKNTIFDSTKDTIGWTFCTSGVLSMNSFCKRLDNGNADQAKLLTGVWKDAILEKAMDLVKFRVAWWFKNLGKGSSESISLIITDIVVRCLNQGKVKVPKMRDWIPSQPKFLKFNVDGSARGSLGQAGIGRVLRDQSKRVLCSFSIYVGCQDVITVELLVIVKACDMCVLKNELLGKKVIISSDSKNTVSWINNSGLRNINFMQQIYNIRYFNLKFGHMCVEFNPRESNMMADSLVKKGVEGDLYVINWFV